MIEDNGFQMHCSFTKSDALAIVKKQQNNYLEWQKSVKSLMHIRLLVKKGYESKIMICFTPQKSSKTQTL